MEYSKMNGIFTNSSQRAAASYLKLLFTTQKMPSGPAPEWTGPQTDLRVFFLDFYTRLYESPGSFGLSLEEDLSIGENEPNPTDKKQAVNRRLNRPRSMIAAGLDFLFLAGAEGFVDGENLIVGAYADCLKRSGITRKFLQGLEAAGLTILSVGSDAYLRHRHYPGMLPALKTLAAACLAYTDRGMGKFQFSRCAIGAVPNESPAPEALFRAFDPADRGRVLALHGYFCQKGYTAGVKLNGLNGWLVAYQGNRKVKATPLFQIEYDDRYTRALRMQIKLASTARFASLIPAQSEQLQQDFLQRANRCRADECNWCRNQSTLGPAVVECAGETHTVCWYNNPDVHVIDDQTVSLIESYEQMHAELAPVG